ncbi:MAG: hypothetical protein A4E45_00193 [Methanosaeta sp. PtaB.Bin039]|nr:MAG: hypothetical protein A4E45_00193 [Methanosaeta sp. PtaB.Bin039]
MKPGLALLRISRFPTHHLYISSPLKRRVGVRMRWLLALVLLSLFALANLASVDARNAVNINQHSYIFINGYMDDTKIYQTDSGFSGQKLVTGTRGSGMVSRRQTVDVWSDNVTGESEIYFNEWGVFQYRPYTPGATQSDLKNALCAKNYDVGSVFSESYSEIQQLVKDTSIYQDDNVSLYLLDSYIKGTARVAARSVNKTGSKRTENMVMSGLYVGEAKIQEEIQIGDNPPLVLPCV